jgi:hypothetical protein
MECRPLAILLSCKDQQLLTPRLRLLTAMGFYIQVPARGKTLGKFADLLVCRAYPAFAVQLAPAALRVRQVSANLVLPGRKAQLVLLALRAYKVLLDLPGLLVCLAWRVLPALQVRLVQ